MKTDLFLPPIMTIHAHQRWDERCSDLKLESEWASRTRLGRKTLAKLRRWCPRHLELIGRDFKGVYYMKTKNGVVFVITPPRVVITVLRSGKHLDDIKEAEELLATQQSGCQQ